MYILSKKLKQKSKKTNAKFIPLVSNENGRLNFDGVRPWAYSHFQGRGVLGILAVLALEVGQ